MEKRLSNKGFMLVECCIVLVAISVFVSVMIPVREFARSEWYLFPSAYLRKQSEAILYSERKLLQLPDFPGIEFNQHGNISKARTITFPYDKRKWIVELGGGRLVER